MARIDPLAGSAGINAEPRNEEIEPLALPREHPQWVRDAVAVSARARALIARARPLLVRVLSFWDHPARSARVGSRTLSIDFSGSYRLN